MEKDSQEILPDALLKISNVDAFYGTFQALWDVSLIVRPGEIVALIGSNASGKSTLINTISGVIHPARGTVEFDGRDISTLHGESPQRLVHRGLVIRPRNHLPQDGSPPKPAR